MGLPRWARPKPLLTGQELIDEIARRRAARGAPPPRIYADPLDETDVCAAGCHPDTLYRVVVGAALVGSLICCECGKVYRLEVQ